jgi:hypothetical protein
MVTHVVVLVENSSQAIKAKKFLVENGIDAKLIPTPRSVSSNCGSAVRILEKNWLEAKKALDDNEAAYSQIVPLTRY